MGPHSYYVDYIILRKKEAINLNPWAAITHHTSQHSECPVLLCAPLTIPPSPTKTLFSLSLLLLSFLFPSFNPFAFQYASLLFPLLSSLICLHSFHLSISLTLSPTLPISYPQFFSSDWPPKKLYVFVLRVRTILIRPNNLNCRSKDCHFSHLIFFVLAFN